MLTKVLEHKWVIRFFGLALIIAPFLNILISGEEVLSPNQHMNWKLFCEFVAGVPVPYQCLEVASFVIGALMLRGQVSAWRFLLGLLGAYIVVQFAHLGKNVRTDKTAWIFIGINVLVFFFIADQLVLKPRPVSEKPKVKPKPGPQPVLAIVPPIVQVAAEYESPIETMIAPLPTPTASVAPLGPRVSRKNIVINLGGVGNWAKLVDISATGLHARCIGDVPSGIVSRRLSITLGEADLKLRFARQSGAILFFEWENLTQLQVRALNTWIRANSAA